MPLWHPPHELGQTLALGCTREFACAATILAPFAIALAFSKMVSAMLVFHLHDITPLAWIRGWTFIQVQNLSFLWILN
jgi:hypothetical protein